MITQLRTFVLMVVCWMSFGAVRSECSGWVISVNELPNVLCNSQDIVLEMNVENDTATLNDCVYAWYVKSPSSTEYILHSNMNNSLYSIEEIGTYSIYATAKPNECESLIVSESQTVTLLPAMEPGVIQSVGAVCYGHTPDLLREIVLPTGGNNDYTRQWEYNNAGEWTVINGAIRDTYQPGPLTATTSYRIKYTSLCGEIYSNSIEVVVHPLPIAPTITDNIQIQCYGSSVSLNCIDEAGGTSGETFSYQWQESTNGSVYNDIPGATGLSYMTPALYETRWYRLQAKSSLGCNVVSSNATKVEVLDELMLVNHTVGPLCYMTTGVIGVSASGAGNNYIYQWKESTDNTHFNDIPGENAIQYTIPPKTAGTYYFKVLVAPTNGCSSKMSETFSVLVYEDLVAGTISGKDTICYNTQPNELQQTVAPTGGNGQFAYQWQSKTTADWSDIVGATSTFYQPNALTETTYYRLVATTSCGQVVSNEIEIYVRQDLTSPIISSAEETVCYGFAPAEIEVLVPSTCGIDDRMTYQWQINTDGYWEDIDGATELSYQPEPIMQTCQYRVVATSVKGCGSRVSNVRTVNVYDDLRITTTGTDPLCYMTSGTIKVTATGDGEEYDYQWQESADATHFVNIADAANINVYVTQPKTEGTYYYRCIVMPTFGCAPDTSNVISVLVYGDVVPGKISLTGNDTICYGFAPDPLEVSVPSTGGDGQYSYQWLHRSDGESDFTIISGATTTTYAPSELFKSTEYVLEVTSACNEPRYTDTIRIYVRDQLVAPVLEEHVDTICYMTIPEPMVASIGARGGIDDSFVYQWQVSTDGINFIDIIGEVDTIYQPDELLQTQYYRLRAISEKSCGEVYSNVIEQNVYDSLHITISTLEPICYMTSTQINVIAQGGGESYSYQWQMSGDAISFEDIPDAREASYETEMLPEGVYYYRCVVTSNKCDGYDCISPVASLYVYDEMMPGTIIGLDSTCYGHAPAGVLMVDVPASGADENFVYQWQYSVNGEWENLEGECTTQYQPDALYDDTDFRLQVVSVCDTLYTNSIHVRVNPLPELQQIYGSSSVCYNQHEIYSVEKLHEGFTYMWSIEEGHGEITTEPMNASAIDILWKNSNTADSVVLCVTNNITGCEQYMKFGVEVCNEQAPNRTIVVRKPNSNILVCEEDAELIYQWGYTKKATNTEELIDDSNRRYVLLPHSFDANIFDYWVILRHTATSPCYSKSYYKPENDTIIVAPDASVSAPTFVRSKVPITIHNPEQEIVHCSIYAVTGEIISKYDLGRNMVIETTLPLTLKAGMYVLHVQMGEYVESIKLIAQ